MMKNLIIISAIGKNHELGCKNDLIWRFKEDLTYFRNATMGHYIVMGQRTYHSLPPTLTGRKYIVISETNIDNPSVITFNTLEAFLEFARSTDEVIFVIGGGMIYKQLFPYSGKMILTEIEASAAHADVFFPKFDKSDWSINPGELQTSPEGIKYKRNIYTRRKN